MSDSLRCALQGHSSKIIILVLYGGQLSFFVSFVSASTQYYPLTLYNKEEHFEVGATNFGNKAECGLSFVIDEKVFVQGNVSLILIRQAVRLVTQSTGLTKLVNLPLLKLVCVRVRVCVCVCDEGRFTKT